MEPSIFHRISTGDRPEELSVAVCAELMASTPQNVHGERDARRGFESRIHGAIARQEIPARVEKSTRTQPTPAAVARRLIHISPRPAGHDILGRPVYDLQTETKLKREQEQRQETEEVEVQIRFVKCSDMAACRHLFSDAGEMYRAWIGGEGVDVEASKPTSEEQVAGACNPPGWVSRGELLQKCTPNNRKTVKTVLNHSGDNTWLTDPKVRVKNADGSGNFLYNHVEFFKGFKKNKGFAADEMPSLIRGEQLLRGGK